MLKREVSMWCILFVCFSMLVPNKIIATRARRDCGMDDTRLSSEKEPQNVAVCFCRSFLIMDAHLAKTKASSS